MHSLEMIKYLNRPKPQATCPQCKQPLPAKPQDKSQDKNHSEPK